MIKEARNNNSDVKSWLDKISQAFSGSEPRDREQLIELLRESEQRNLLDADALAMIEGVLQVSEMHVRDIMVPRSQMIVVKRDVPLKEFLPAILESGHSRFPVIDGNRDEIIGILLAKDLLACFANQNEKTFDIRDIMRSPVFIPESKRLNVLLKDFRSNRNHMAVVADEFGGVAGLVTIEDVLEQIVGEIEDEFDVDDESFIKSYNNSDIFSVKALTPIDDFNTHFNASFSDEEFDTIGGLVMNSFGYLPKRDETTVINEQYQFTVLRADNRRIHLLKLQLLNHPQQAQNHREH